MRSPSRIAYGLLLVPMAVLALFVLLPTVLGLATSVFQWDGSGSPRFVGAQNFRALADDRRFIPALANTIIFTALTVPAQVLAGFGLAALVNARWFVGRTLARTMLFLPTIVSVVAIGFVWRWMLDERAGLLPGLLSAVGVAPPNFLEGGAIVSGPWGVTLSWPLLSIAAVQVWKMAGFCMVLYLAALQSVGEQLYEAAEIDGANRWQVLTRITWPCVAPMTIFLLVTGVIGALQVFDVIWAMTGQAESDATRVLNTMIFREFQQSRYGYASALGVVIFVLTAGVTWMQLARRGRGESP